MKSVRTRLTVLLLLGFALLLGAGGLAIYFSARMALYKEFDSTLKVQAHSMAALARPGREGIEFAPRRRGSQIEATAGMAAFYQLFRADGTPLVRSPSLLQSDLPLRVGTLSQPALWNLTLPNGKPGRAAGVRFTATSPQRRTEREEFEPEHMSDLAEFFKFLEEEDLEREAETRKASRPPVELNLVIADDRSRLDEALGTLLTIVLGAGLATLLCTMAMISLVLRWGLTPLRRLADSAGRISASSLRTRFATDQMPGELTPIVQTLNDLLSRLEASFEHERRFSADLAHELRTPLAGLRTTAEVALKYGDSQANEREAFRSVLQIAQEMEGMVNRLLILARSEHRTLPIHREHVPVKPLVQSLWEPLRARAAGRGISNAINIDHQAAIPADRELLRGILMNLLTNAVDYTPANGEIQIGFARQNGCFELTVANAVDNLDREDLPKLFERFWRKDNARSDAAHTGLGLPLAKSFAELSGLALEATLTENRQKLTLILRGKAGAEEQAGGLHPEMTSAKPRRR